MNIEVLFFITFVLCSAVPTTCLPAVDFSNSRTGVEHVDSSRPRSLWKRFVDTSSSFGGFNHSGVGKMRTRRSSDEECEQLQLCKLHARSATSFLAAFQLYFVNKENARLWDHRARTAADCERRFNCYR